MNDIDLVVYFIGPDGMLYCAVFTAYPEDYGFAPESDYDGPPSDAYPAPGGEA